MRRWFAVTATVAVGATPLLGHGDHPQAADRSPVTTARQQLLQTLGVLRTSPTATDRKLTGCIRRTAKKPGGAKCLRYVPEAILIAEDPAPMASSLLASMGNPKWDLTLIRTVPLGRSGRSVTLFPGTWRPFTDVGGEYSSPPSAKKTCGIAAAVVDHGQAYSPATSVGALRAHGLALWPYPEYLKAPIIVIVPDGVARITVATANLGTQHRIENVTAAVHDNVAAVKLKNPVLHWDGLEKVTLQMSWFDSQGHLIRHTTVGVDDD
jgi:hypothetical protein